MDAARAAANFKRYAGKPQYKDFRVMLDKEEKNIDAVVIALDRDLRAQTRVARGAEDIDKPLANFRHLDLEQLDEELR